ncbi:MAG: nicotinate (nicotinamide) nucleotide adenylyltransferase [Acidobacteriia bacterium]|nr:nicotinate (nicotinamide) nucleotide adenylyltransferase [Terriglobia bacterium]
MTANRIGVLGGSFNPVHLGHLHLAQLSREIFGLSQVLFAVASVPPHKPPQDLIPFTHRYAMVALATSGLEYLVPSMVELEPPASPYSISTLAKLARRFGTSGKDLYFLAGGDSLLDVAGWHNSETLLMSNNFVFVMRPGVNAPDLRAALPQAAAPHVVDCRGLDSGSMRRRVAAELATPECRIFLVDAGAPDIAASQIRKLASLGQSIGHLVPASVHEYILKLHLYGE